MADCSGLLHATAVALWGADGWRAALITGTSGAGKSDLALRLMGRGWRLVGDDYVDVRPFGDALYVTGRSRIAGMIEARGLGLLTASPIPVARAVLVLSLSQTLPERLPLPEFQTIQGVRLPALALDPRPASAVDIVAGAMRRL